MFLSTTATLHYLIIIITIIIIKRISRAPIYHTRWQHRVLYNNTNHTHTRTRTHTHTHAHTQRASDEGMGRAVKNSLEIIIKQVRLEGGFERGGRIRVAGCLRQIVPDSWASIRKRSYLPPTPTSKMLFAVCLPEP